MKTVKIDLRQDAIDRVLQNIGISHKADLILDYIKDNDLNDLMLDAFCDCLNLGFRVGFDTAENLYKGNLEFNIQVE